MPTPGKKEDQKSFISRCIPIVLKEGTAKDNKQAAAICHSLWKKKGQAETVDDKEALKKLAKELGMEGESDQEILKRLLEEQLGEELTNYGRIQEIPRTESENTEKGNGSDPRAGKT